MDAKFSEEISKVSELIEEARTRLDAIADSVHALGRTKRREVQEIEQIYSYLGDCAERLDDLKNDLSK